MIAGRRWFVPDGRYTTADVDTATTGPGAVGRLVAGTNRLRFPAVAVGARTLLNSVGHRLTTPRFVTQSGAARPGCA